MASSMEKAFTKAGFKPAKPRKAREPKVIKCRKCGTAMERIPETNIMICPGEIEVKSNEGMSTIPCGNRIIFS
ncbi:MAG: hypothetical protein RBR68_14830 [Tenuifilaceae bacterium]|nr:hypothetical protein [Tenuifilaceae bacterium]